MLLGRDDVDPDALDRQGETPLSRAAQWGNGEVVKIPLQSDDLDPDRPDLSN